MSLDASLQLCVHVSRHLLHSYCIMIALCFSLNYVSLPCVLFLFMQLQSCYTRKNHLCVPLMLSLFVPSFFLSGFLSFLPFFTVWSLCRQIVWGWICLICYRSSLCTFERSLKCLTLGQEVFRILKHDKILQKPFEMHAPSLSAHHL